MVVIEVEFIQVNGAVGSLTNSSKGNFSQSTYFPDNMRHLIRRCQKDFVIFTLEKAQILLTEFVYILFHKCLVNWSDDFLGRSWKFKTGSYLIKQSILIVRVR